MTEKAPAPKADQTVTLKNQATIAGKDYEAGDKPKVTPAQKEKLAHLGAIDSK